MSSKPIVPRNGKAMTNWVNQDGAPSADDLLSGYRGDSLAKAAAIATPGPQSVAPTAGSIAFTGFNADGSDSVSFVALADIASGQVIYFTDNGWNGSVFATNEGRVAWTASGPIAAGTIVLISNYNGVPTSNLGTCVASGSRDFSGTAEVVYAYVADSGTPTVPTAFLAAIAVTPYGSATDTLSGTGLTAGTNALQLATGVDIGAYNGSRTGVATYAGYLSVINNASNWVTQDASGDQSGDGTAPDIPFSTTGFTLAGGTPTLSINDVNKAEGDSGTVIYTFTVSLTAPAGVGGVTFDIATANGTATTADNDYVARSLTSQTIPEGSTAFTFDVTVNGDDVPEGNEAFFVNVTNVVGATAGDTQGQGTITNDDNYGALAINDVTLAEGNSGTTNFTFTVTRSGGDDGAVSADYTVNLPGGAGADASDVSGTLSGTVSFADGETSKTITVTVNGDLVEEPNETFTVTLSNQQGGVTISDASGLGTITNDNSPPVGSINDVSITEGADGVTYMTFTVQLDHSSTSTVTFDFATANGTATAGSDYVAHNGQISFAPGETSQTISIPIIGDTARETNETLTVTLSNPVGGSIGDGSGTGTITNDDGGTLAYYSLAGGSFTQDWSNTNQITADDNWSGVPFIIGYLGDINSGSPTGVDARAVTGANLGAIDVIANQTSSTNISGGVGEFFNTDPLNDLNNATIGLQGSGTADAPSIVLYMDATGRSDVRVQAHLRDIDGGTDDAAQQIAVQYRTSPTGAWLNAPGGYFADVTTAGSATQVTAVDITLPSDANGAATLEIRFLTTNANGSDEWVGIDDIAVSSQQSGPILSIGNTAVYEGDAGNTPITFTVTRAGSSVGAVTADYTVNFPGGINGADSNDFAAGQLFTGQVSFADGQTTATITLNVAGDVNPELDNNFTVSLSNVVGGTIGDGVGTGTIINDDGQPPLVSVSDVIVTEGDSGTTQMVFTITRTGGTGAFDVEYGTHDATATAPSDYTTTQGTLHFADGVLVQTVTVTINGDTDSEPTETLNLVLSNATDNAVITDAVGVGTIAGDDPIYIHDIQGTAYFSPLLAAEGIHAFNVASAGLVTVRAIVTAVDDDGNRQGYYLSEEVTDWDGNSYTSEGIFVMTRDDTGVGGSVVSGVTVGDLVQVSANVMEYQAFGNMPRTLLVNPTGLSVISHGNPLPVITLDHIPNEVLTAVTPDYFDSHDDPNDTFDASTYALSYFETVEGMLVRVPNMVVADGFVQGGQASPFFQAYSLDSANPDQINSRGGYTIAGDPPFGPPDTPGTGDDTHNGGLVLHDGDVNPDVIQLEFGGFGMDAPAGLHDNASMGDQLGDITGIIDFDFTDRVLYVTDMNPASFVDNQVTQDTTLFGGDSRALTMAAFNVNNLDPTDGAARFTAIANAIAHNLNAPDIISIEEIQDNNGAAAGDGIDDDPITPGMQDVTGTDASQTWQMLVDALNLATGAHYQWVDQAPVYGAEGGEPGGNIRVGFLYNTDRVQLGDLDANATLAERRAYTDRVGDGVRDAGDLIAYDDSMIAGEIATSDWASTRRSLLAEFTFHGNTIYATANHFSAKGGSGEFWQFDQDQAGDPLNAGWDKRNDQAQDIYTMLNLIQQSDSNVGIISAGDYNDFYFYNPLTTVTGYTMSDGTERVGGARFDNLTLTLAEAERYTYTFDGRSQAIDHIIVNDLLAGVATYDVVHLNTGFNPANTLAISDHDPGISTFDFRNFAEVLAGTTLSDSINGFGGDDVISTFDGSDELIGGAGADTLIGGAGNDYYRVEDQSDRVIEAAGGGTDTVYAVTSYALAGGTEVEFLATLDRAATSGLNLRGNEFDNVLIGNAGSNELIGEGGADVLVGLAGNDYYRVEDQSDRVIEAVGEGTDTVYAVTSYALAGGTEVEFLAALDRAATSALNLRGNEFDNVLIGNAGVNELIGEAGADVLVGLAGNDYYRVEDQSDRVIEAVGGGTDTVYAVTSYALSAGSEVEFLAVLDRAATSALNLTGNEFANVLIGNAGANVLDGKGGSDTLVGLGGADTFAFTTTLGGSNVDTLADFASGTDKIGLAASIFSGIGSAGNPFNANAFFAGTAAHDADDRIIYDSATGNLYYDADGNGGGAQVLFATLQGHPALVVSDFTVI